MLLQDPLKGSAARQDTAATSVSGRIDGKLTYHPHAAQTLLSSMRHIVLQQLLPHRPLPS
jgi:hypothetical protein